MKADQIHRASRRAILALASLALLAVLSGYLQAPQPDEGAAAHIFQITIVLLGPALLLFLVSADWNSRRKILLSLLPALLTLTFAFAALYYLEHYRYAQAALHNLR